MVRFIQRWIERSMEDPAAREANARAHVTEVLKGCERLKKEWDYAARPKGYWNAPQSTASTRNQAARANAIPLSPYKATLIEMDEKRIRDEGRKN